MRVRLAVLLASLCVLLLLLPGLFSHPIFTLRALAISKTGGPRVNRREHSFPGHVERSAFRGASLLDRCKSFWRIWICIGHWRQV